MDNYTTIVKTMNSRPITIEDFLKIEASSNTDPKNRGKFIVPHSKLYEYGITVDDRSNRVKERIDTLGLTENVDYYYRSFGNNQRGKPKIEYTFTPKAFKNILLYASIRPYF